MKNNSPNTIIQHQNNHNMHRTHARPRRMENRRKTQSQPTIYHQQDKGNYPRPKSRRKHLILCTLGRQHPPCRTKHPCKRTGTRDRENNKKHEPHVRLLREKSECNSKILPILHDIKRALRCVISFSKKRQESCSWPFLPRLATRLQTTHPPERANPDTLHNPQVRRSIRSGS